MSKEIKRYDFKPGLPQEFEIINFKYLSKEFSEEITHPHRAEFYQILWFQKGTPNHLIDFNSIAVKPNTLLFVNKNSVQLFDHQADFKAKIFLFTDNFFCKNENDTRFLRSSILFNDLLSISRIDLSESLSNFTAIFSQMENELKNSKDHYQSDIIRNHLHNLLLHSERERRKQDFIELKRDAFLDSALELKDLLDKHYIKHKNVGFYCEKMHFTSKKLNHVTTKIFGKTPKELIDDRVLLASKRVLVHTNQSIKEIAFSLGFEEPTNFIKYFKKHTNRTPLEFRAEFAAA